MLPYNDVANYWQCAMCLLISLVIRSCRSWVEVPISGPMCFAKTSDAVWHSAELESTMTRNHQQLRPTALDPVHVLCVVFHQGNSSWCRSIVREPSHSRRLDNHWQFPGLRKQPTANGELGGHLYTPSMTYFGIVLLPPVKSRHMQNEWYKGEGKWPIRVGHTFLALVPLGGAVED